MRFAMMPVLLTLFWGAWESTGRPAPPIHFESGLAASSIGFVLRNGTVPEKPIIDTTLGGVALFDFDNDGFLDIFFTNGAAIPGLVKDGPAFWNRLYRNNRDGTFSDVTAHSGVAGEGYSMGVATGDFDNDGYIDLFVTGVNRNTLFHNNGDGTFTDITQRAGLLGFSASGKKAWSVSAAWVDYNLDGKLDLFVSSYVDWSMATNSLCGEEGKRLSCAPATYRGLPNYLYRNNGDGTFTDVSEITGIAGHVGKGMGVAIADYNGDGYPDIFVANDNERNFLFQNDGGKRFHEVGISSGVAFTEDGVPVSAMGADFRDLNNDGRPDLVVTALEGETFPVFLNLGNGFFSESSYQTGVGPGSLRKSGWSVGAYDFDNDGNKDIFTANSHVSENAPLYGPHLYKQSNSVWRNQGAGKFQDVSTQAGAAFRVLAAHRGAAFGDLDNDGRVDIVVSSIGERPEILLNRSSRANHWLLIQTKGKSSNRDGIGATIKVTSQDGMVQYNHVTTSVGYASASDKRVHFGLGKNARVREVEVTWPSGKIQRVPGIAADRVLLLEEP